MINVIGFEVINEPHPGYIGLPKVTETFNQESNLNLGASPSALQSMAAGNGERMVVDNWVKWWPRPTKKQGTVVINEDAESVWLNNDQCKFPHYLFDRYLETCRCLGNARREASRPYR